MLYEVVNAEDGTGRPAHSKLFPISGKTGTAQLNYGNDRSHISHQVSFCGYFPSDKPRYSMIVVIRQPRNGYASGGTMAGSVFKTVAEDIYNRRLKPQTQTVLPPDTLHPLEPLDKKSLESVEIQNGIVPNVCGLGAKNALYAVEKAGGRVRLHGKGTVISQSVATGQVIRPGERIDLYLR
jgi:cell division protein FtsI (penicillin-binding protein 3)